MTRSLIPSTTLRARTRTGLMLAAGLVLAGAAQAEEKFTYLTNWYAQAEHGGFYQALATGLYKKAGLDVTLKMGGPQVNGLQLIAANQAECYMGYDTQTMKAREQGVPAMTVAASFQKDPQVLLAHPQVKKLEDLKGKTVLIASASYSTFWPWLKSTYGFTDDMAKPYTFNVQPFMADKDIAQQGYLSSEPYKVEKEGKFKPSVFLLSDFGWPPYSTSIVCMEKTVKERKAAVAAFVKATMEGWKSYLGGDPSPANALIKKDNPNMTDDLIANGIAKMKETGMVTGGDAAKLGIGIMTDERMKKTFDMMVANKLLDPTKVDLKTVYTTEFVRDLKVMP
jgi:NitT/TauT family transport system substrate-binding protein